MQKTAGATSQSVSVYCRALSGVALTGKGAADFSVGGTSSRIWYRRGGDIVPVALTDLTALTDAWSSGGVIEVANGEYRVDLPDAAFATGAAQVSMGGDVDGGVVLGYPIALVADKQDTILANIALIEPEAGPGADDVTVTINVGGSPVADADVWITSDQAGDVHVQGPLRTNDAGQATFSLDAGVSYYMWMQKSGVNPIRGQQFTAVADE
jgi:hypothetical protein